MDDCEVSFEASQFVQIVKSFLGASGIMRYCFSFALVILCCSAFRADARGSDKSEVVVGIDAVRLEKLFFEAMDLLQSKAAKTSGYAVYEIANDQQIGKSNVAKANAEVREISVSGETCLKIVRTVRDLDALEVINDNYAFVLNRSKAGAFSIAGVQQKGRSLPDDLLIRDRMNDARYYLLDAYSYYGRTVWGLVRDPGFKLIKIHAFDDDAGEIRVRVDFNYAPVNKLHEGVTNIDDWTLKGAYLIFGTKNGWKLFEYGRPGLPRTVVTVNNHPSDQLGFTESAVARVMGNGGTVKQEDWVRCVKSSYDPIPKEQFYLRHYGFPEPNFGTPPLWPWILGGAILAAVCFFASRRLLRRSNAT